MGAAEGEPQHGNYLLAYLHPHGKGALGRLPMPAVYGTRAATERRPPPSIGLPGALKLYVLA